MPGAMLFRPCRDEIPSGSPSPEIGLGGPGGGLGGEGTGSVEVVSDTVDLPAKAAAPASRAQYSTMTST